METTPADSGQPADNGTDTAVDSDLRIQELEMQLAEAKEQLLREVAEMANYRKRLERDKASIFDITKTDVISRFLPVYDDLVRSLEATPNLNPDDAFVQGVKMVSDKFAGVLGQYQIERIDAVMVPFDVEVHEALMRQKHDDSSIEPNTVIMMLEPGYRMGDKVIRHAKVMVSE